jgi:regulatory protein
MRGGSGQDRRPTLLQRAIGLLARREHSRFELARKLERVLAEGEGRADIDAVLDELQRRKLLSDARFAAEMAASRGDRFGAARIAHDLRAHHVDDDLRRGTVAELQKTEFARARAVWQRRFGAPAADAAGRAKQMRFLAGRGFSEAVIRRVVRGAEE